MKVLIACEQTGVVRDAFRKKGHEAYSCDIEPNKSEYHIQGDILTVLPAFDGDIELMIAHPPCTYLCNSGVRWLKDNPDRQAKLNFAAMFFRTLLEADIPKICIENPVPHKYAIESIGRKYDQTIQPYQFGHPESKRTCLWLKGLPLLRPTKILKRPEQGYWNNQTPSGQNRLGPSKDRAMMRSVTYQGIANAMVKQWSGKVSLFV